MELCGKGEKTELSELLGSEFTNLIVHKLRLICFVEHFVQREE